MPRAFRKETTHLQLSWCSSKLRDSSVEVSRMTVGLMNRGQGLHGWGETPSYTRRNKD